mmetsp:Transcript_46920/g.150561  ORF Transcript_46920/g.150561 Transcript_46920/m.150561 type:complete len:268 (-) Transcript_46920:806-1609(-)
MPREDGCLWEGQQAPAPGDGGAAHPGGQEGSGRIRAQPPPGRTGPHAPGGGIGGRAGAERAGGGGAGVRGVGGPSQLHHCYSTCTHRRGSNGGEPLGGPPRQPRLPAPPRRDILPPGRHQRHPRGNRGAVPQGRRRQRGHGGGGREGHHHRMHGHRRVHPMRREAGRMPGRVRRDVKAQRVGRRADEGAEKRDRGCGGGRAQGNCGGATRPSSGSLPGAAVAYGRSGGPGGGPGTGAARAREGGRGKGSKGGGECGRGMELAKREGT